MELFFLERERCRWAEQARNGAVEGVTQNSMGDLFSFLN